MPLISGAEVLRAAREISPATMRILLTGYSELAGIVGSINEGEIFRYVQKPWRLQELRNTIDQAVDIAKASRSSEADDVLNPEVKKGSIIVLHSKKAIAQYILKEKPDVNVSYAASLDDALSLLEVDPQAILLTDLTISEGAISEGLALLKQCRPQLVVIVVTAFSDTSQLINLINSAQVYRVLPLPISRNMLITSIDSALRHNQLLANRPAMLQRHRVEPVKAQQQQLDTNHPVLHRIRGYLERIRA
jgi:serine/threonine-protein kinase